MSMVSREARSLLLDVSEGPDKYWLVSLDAEHEIVDFVGEFTDSEMAHAAAEAAARKSGLPLSIKHTPHTIADHFASLPDSA